MSNWFCCLLVSKKITTFFVDLFPLCVIKRMNAFFMCVLFWGQATGFAGTLNFENLQRLYFKKDSIFWYPTGDQKTILNSHLLSTSLVYFRGFGTG